MDKTRIEEEIYKRARKVCHALKPILKYLPETFVVAGGCTSDKQWNDIDIFAPVFSHAEKIGQIVSNNKNAVTIKLSDGNVIQLCKYWKDTLEKLVESFDFGIIQSGALINNKPSVLTEYSATVEQVYISDLFIENHACRSATYCGSEYPLSSLLRCRKYKERGWMTNGEYAKNMITILRDIVKRGFTSYNDFKDQLDAVDLFFLPTEYEDVGIAPLEELFTLLEKK